MRQQPAITPGSSTALIVFSSTATADGYAGGRTGMNNICLSQDQTSHFCSVTEIETAWENGGVLIQSPFLTAWVDNPSFAGDWKHYSSNGWSYNGIVDYYGTWIGDNGQTEVAVDQYNHSADCTQVDPVICCKSTP
jgi:hypothetical protein